MPIVDGLTSTKMIRSFEKTHSSSSLSERAALNGRIPIIAVSASLVERERQTYMDAGFDAWILKPISFDRLQVLLTGIVDPKTREECLYKQGKWESGGWFDMARTESRFEAETKPDASKETTDLATTATDTRAEPTQKAVAEQDPQGRDKCGVMMDGVAEPSDAASGQSGNDKAAEGVEASDQAYAGKSASAPAAMGGGGSGEADSGYDSTKMVTDESAISETPQPIQSPPPT